MERKVVLPKQFSICKKNTELVQVERTSEGFFIGNVIEYDPYLTSFTDKMVWRDADVRGWLENRTIPQNRPMVAVSLARFGMETWDLEELIVRTRGFLMKDFYWVRFFIQEKIESMSPRFDDSAFPFLSVDEQGNGTFVGWDPLKVNPRKIK